MFSILLPTWNNLALLKLCVQSIRAHSAHDHQIIVHVNDGSDGTLAWVREQGLDHTHSPENVGICLAVNESAMLARHDYIVYLNDDMVCCPGWDTALLRRLDSLDTDLFMLSGTMIEPVDTGNPCVVVGDYGRDADTFDAARLLADVPRLVRGDWFGATWPPTLVHRRWWFKLGGYSSELTPGMSSDNDFSMKLWHAGCRIFLGAATRWSTTSSASRPARSRRTTAAASSSTSGGCRSRPSTSIFCGAAHRPARIGACRSRS